MPSAATPTVVFHQLDPATTELPCRWRVYSIWLTVGFSRCHKMNETRCSQRELVMWCCGCCATTHLTSPTFLLFICGGNRAMKSVNSPQPGRVFSAWEYMYFLHYVSSLSVSPSCHSALVNGVFDPEMLDVLYLFWQFLTNRSGEDLGNALELQLQSWVTCCWAWCKP